MPIYILTLCKIAKGEPTGFISDLFEDAFSNLNEAEQAFDSIPLSTLYFRKELWQKTEDGRRIMLKEERYYAERHS